MNANKGVVMLTCLTSEDLRLEIYRKLHGMNKKRPFKISVAIYKKENLAEEGYKDPIAEKVVSTPEAYHDFGIKYGVDVPIPEIFRAFEMALESPDERTCFCHHLLKEGE